MPSKKSAKYVHQEEQIAKALKECERVSRKGIKINFLFLQEKYGVNRVRIARRWKGGESRSTRKMRRLLNEEEEETFFEWLTQMEAVGCPVKKSQLLNSANLLLALKARSTGETRQEVGKNWPDRFMKRWKEVEDEKTAEKAAKAKAKAAPAKSAQAEGQAEGEGNGEGKADAESQTDEQEEGKPSRKKQKRAETKPFDMARIESCNPSAMTHFYQKLGYLIIQKQMNPDDIWNMNAASFSFAWTAEQKAAASASNATKPEKTSVTVIDAISNEGKTIPPLVVFPGTSTQVDVSGRLPSDHLMFQNGKGTLDDMVALDWMEHFCKHVAPLRKGQHIILLLDAHASCSTQQFISLAHQHDIVLCQLPLKPLIPLQPLQAGVFTPYRNWHRQALEHADKTGDGGAGTLDKAAFVGGLSGARQENLTREKIMEAFNQVGLSPFDPDKVLQPLRERQPQQQLSPPVSQQQPKQAIQQQSQTDAAQSVPGQGSGSEVSAGAGAGAGAGPGPSAGPSADENGAAAAAAIAAAAAHAFDSGFGNGFGHQVMGHGA